MWRQKSAKNSKNILKTFVFRYLKVFLVLGLLSLSALPSLLAEDISSTNSSLTEGKTPEELKNLVVKYQSLALRYWQQTNDLEAVLTNSDKIYLESRQQLTELQQKLTDWEQTFLELKNLWQTLGPQLTEFTQDFKKVNESYLLLSSQIKSLIPLIQNLTTLADKLAKENDWLRIGVIVAIVLELINLSLNALNAIK